MRFLTRWATISALCLGLGGSAAAQTPEPGPLALRGLEGQIAVLKAEGGNPFELGALQVLRAVEKSLQARYDYGLGDSMLNMPLLRLQAGGLANRAAKPKGPETLSRIIAAFVADIEAARTTLARAQTDGVIAFELPIQDIWFDANLNARRDQGEGVFDLLGPLMLSRRDARDLAQNPQSLVVRFDAADHAWLVAYTHMLSGFGHAFLAFDPTPVFARLDQGRDALKAVPRLPEYYDLDAVMAERAALRAGMARLEARLEQVRQEQNTFNTLMNSLRTERRSADDARRAEIDAQMAQVRDKLRPINDDVATLYRQRRSLRSELEAAEAKLPGGGNDRVRRQAEEFRPTLDALYVLIAALKQQPDGAQVQAALADWRAMIAENRRFWALVETETDNDREWIPNARQQAVLPVEIDPGLAGAWQDVLADAEAVLNGRLLIPHPLLPPGHGISLAHYEQNPTPIDLTEAIHGIGFYPHVAKGPMISPQSWQAFNRLARGRGGLFSIWFN